jgi:hypothetical protein
MFLFDVPDIPFERAVMAAPRKSTYETVGICHFAENPSEPDNAANMLSVEDEVRGIFAERHWTSSLPVVTKVVRAPQHGVLLPDPPGVFTYHPHSGYLGNDRITIIAKAGQKTLRMEYFVRVVTAVQGNDQEPDMYEQGYCPVKARVWRIKSTRQ